MTANVRAAGSASAGSPWTDSAPSERPSTRIDGSVVDLADPTRPLSDVVRTSGTAGTVRIGCEVGDCGACTVLVDDRPTLSCLLPAALSAGRSVRTAVAVAGTPAGAALARAVTEGTAAQCGFCTAGLLCAVVGWAHRHGPPTDRAAAAEALAGSVCRCSGYDGYLEAVASWGRDQVTGRYV